MSRFRNHARVVPRRLLAGVACAVSCLAICAPAARAAVTTVGAVSNAPPVGGGAVVGPFVIGDGAFGSVTVNAGTAITSNGGATIGNNLGGIGLVSLTGFGSDWTITGSGSDLTLGDEGVGQVTVANSAQLTVPDDTFIGAQSTANGKLVVSGLGSRYAGGDIIIVGSAGQGAVEILNGGNVTSTSMFLGASAGSRGLVTISGDLSRWNATTLTLGQTGEGRVTITGGGVLNTSGIASFGLDAGAVGEIGVFGVGSHWSATGAGHTIGSSGNGTLVVFDGGRATIASSLTVGSSASSAGFVAVDGAGSRLTVGGAFSTSNGEAYVTVSNNGLIRSTTVSISAGGRVALAGGRWEATSASNSAVLVNGLLEGSGVIDAQGVTISGGANRGRLHTAAGDRLRLTGLAINNGLIDLAGGELDIAGTLINNNVADIDARNGAVLRVGGAGLTNANGSQISITSGVVDVFGAVTNNLGGQIAVVGRSTAVFHDAFTNNGGIFVSASSELVLLENLSFNTASSLAVQLAPPGAMDDPADGFGLVSVGGAAALSGTLAVSLASGFSPSPGDSFEILRSAGGLSGTFADVALPTLPGGLSLDVLYTPTSVMLAVVPSGFAADFDNDGDVDADDLAIWRGAYLQNALADATGDGVSDGADFLVWQRQVGSGSNLAAQSSVPEPAGCALAAAIGLAASAAQRRDALRRRHGGLY